MHKIFLTRIHFIIFTSFILLWLPAISAADMCPSVKDIQQNRLRGWVMYDTDDGTQLSKQRVAQFKKLATQFVLAEWVDENQQNGTMHCYYRDKEGSELSAYLAKDNFIPENGKSVWYQVSGSVHCAAGADQCVFQQGPQTPLTTEPQLANRSSTTTAPAHASDG